MPYNWHSTAGDRRPFDALDFVARFCPNGKMFNELLLLGDLQWPGGIVCSGVTLTLLMSISVFGSFSLILILP